MIRPLFVVAMLAVFPVAVQAATPSGWTVQASLDEEGRFAACLASHGEGLGGYLGLGVNADAQPLIVLANAKLHLSREARVQVRFRFGAGPATTAQAIATDARTLVFPIPDAAIATFATTGTLTITVAGHRGDHDLAGSATAIRALGDCVAAAGAVHPARS